MAIDNTKPQINSDYFANGKDGRVVTSRIGVDDGSDFNAGDVVVDDGSTVRLASDREVAAYDRIKTEVDRAAARAAIRTATTVEELRDALIAAGLV